VNKLFHVTRKLEQLVFSLVYYVTSVFVTYFFTMGK